MESPQRKQQNTKTAGKPSAEQLRYLLREEGIGSNAQLCSVYARFVIGGNMFCNLL